MRQCILVVLGLVVACRAPPPASPPARIVEPAVAPPSKGISAAMIASPPPFHREPMAVVDVIDGDTLVVDEAGRRVIVHLLGVDAPEIAGRNEASECFGREAADLLRQLVAGRLVQLRPNAAANAFDELRRYVYVVVDTGQAVAVNWALVWQGYAWTQSTAPNTHEQETYRQAEQAARESGRGLWASTTCNGQRRAVLPA